MERQVNHQILIDTQERVGQMARITPVLTSTSFSQESGANLFFKCENFQRTASFKIRGAFNAIESIAEDKRAHGVVAHSSGNFAQAVACAARFKGMQAHLVMPQNAPKIKVAGVRAFDANIHFCESTLPARESKTLEIHQRTGATILHPSNQWEVILGQSTCAGELLNAYPDLDMIFCPVGGGGLLAGTGLAAHYHHTDVEVIGCEPANCDDAFRSLQAGKIITENNGTTIADGLRTHLGDVNFPLISRYVERIVRVSEDDIIHALQLIYNRLKIVVETSSAVALAGVLTHAQLIRGKKVGVILTGGNIDLNQLAQYFIKKD